MHSKGLFFTLVAINLINNWSFIHNHLRGLILISTKVTSCVTAIPPPPPPTRYPPKWTIKLLFKNSRICKHETKYKTPPYPSLFYVDAINMPFRSSRGHLASGAKSNVYCENPTNLVLWYEAPIAIWYHIFMCFLLLDLWFVIKTKVIV